MSPSPPPLILTRIVIVSIILSLLASLGLTLAGRLSFGQVAGVCYLSAVLLAAVFVYACVLAARDKLREIAAHTLAELRSLDSPTPPASQTPSPAARPAAWNPLPPGPGSS